MQRGTARRGAAAPQQQGPTWYFKKPKNVFRCGFVCTTTTEHGGVGQAVVSLRHKLQAIESALSVTRPSGSRSPKSSGHRRRQEPLSPSHSLCPSQMENEIATRLANRETQQQRYFRKLIVQRMDSSKRKLQGRLIRKLVISVYTPGLCVMKEEVCISRCRHLLSLHSFVNKTKVVGLPVCPDICSLGARAWTAQGRM